MPLVQLSSVALAYGHVPLLDRVDLVIEPGQRLGLIGRNGTGKSSLLRLIAGERQPDDGSVWLAPGLKVASVTQEPAFSPGQTVFETVAEGLGQGARLLVDYHAAAQALAGSSGEGDQSALFARLHDVQEKLDEDGWNQQHKVETTLSRLQLSSLQDTKVDELSGGLKKRVALARALAGAPDLLLLDEPTNHLDVTTIEWLESTLLAFPGSVLLVTHDRRFLDNVVTGILELDRGNLAAFPGNFAAYQVKKAEMLETEAKHQRKFDKVLAQEEVWIRKGIEARRTRNEGRVRRLDSLRLERAARRDRIGKVELALSEGERSGKLVAELLHVGKSYGKKVVVDDFSCRILRGDKVGFIGPNGSGKTTLLKILLDELKPDSGEVRHGTRLEFAYFDQFRAVLNEEATLADTISQGGDFIDVGGARKHVISYLGDFLFPPERVRAPVKSLSGGERNRLLLARLFSRPANVLVLDEPTNDLDIETLELLEALLQEFSGTLLLVSHDRAFIDNVVTQTIASEGNGVWKEYAGGYSDWQRASQASSVKAISENSTVPDRTAKPAPRATSKSRLSYKENRELEGLPGKISALEGEQGAISTLLGDPLLYRDEPERVRTARQRFTEIEQELTDALVRWEQLSAKQ